MLACLLAVCASGRGQTATWNGHSYEVVWFPTELLNERNPAGQYGFLDNGYSPQAPQLSPRALGGHLASITYPEEIEIVRDLVLKATVDPRAINAWCPSGLNAYEDRIDFFEFRWTWDNGEPYVRLGLQNTPFNEIGVLPGFENGVIVYYLAEEELRLKPLRRWQESHYFYILEKEPPPPGIVANWNGHSYEIIPGRTSWGKALQNAVAMGGHLLTVASAEEWETVKFLVNTANFNVNISQRSFPLALQFSFPYSQPFRWESGEKSVFSDWASGHPGIPAEDLVYASGGLDHKWKIPTALGYYFE